MYKIYRVDFSATGMSYVGCTKNLPNRLRAHCSKKYLPFDDGYTVIILAHCWGSKQLAETIEQQCMIDENCIWPHGHNLHGQTGPRSHHQATRAKLSAAALGRPSALKGRKLSQEVRQKMCETRQALAAVGKWGGKKGFIMPEETKKKISDAKKGKSSWSKGVKFSEERLAKMRGPRTLTTPEAIAESKKRRQEWSKKYHEKSKANAPPKVPRKPLSDESRAKMSAAKKGKPSPFKGVEKVPAEIQIAKRKASYEKWYAKKKAAHDAIKGPNKTFGKRDPSIGKKISESRKRMLAQDDGTIRKRMGRPRSSLTEADHEARRERMRQAARARYHANKD